MTEFPDQITVTLKTNDETPANDGAEIRACEGCGHNVLLNPATVHAIEAGVYPDFVVCLDCALENNDG